MEMLNTVGMLLELVKREGSGLKVASRLGVSHVTFMRWKKGTDFPSDENAVKIAELLGIDERFTLAVVQRDRSKTAHVKDLWTKIAESLAVFVLTVGAASFGAAPSAQAASAVEVNSNTHCRTKRRGWSDAVQP